MVILGEIFTRVKLDREVRPLYELTAVARDEGSPPHEVRVHVSVRVTDANDNAPEVIEPRDAVVSVREEQPPETEVTRVRAVDRDQGENATVYFSFIEGKLKKSYLLIFLSYSINVCKEGSNFAFKSMT